MPLDFADRFRVGLFDVLRARTLGNHGVMTVSSFTVFRFVVAAVDVPADVGGVIDVACSSSPPLAGRLVSRPT